ncbi:MAG: peptidoglycan editing factor PgeF [Paludibacteraceae bacterium]|nr:peptidoglycan editing factor PgeF [Paludibacteraceae bacterium]MBR4839758.1 peptidoglycan editing factor PgeF [Paludibacteraceae bacterium]
MPITLEQCDLFGRQENLRHFFTTVEGGCSNGNYSTFNLGAYCGDLPENVKANRKILCQELNISPERLIVPREIHKDGIFLIDESFFEKDEEERIQTLLESDALITRMKGICLGVTTADCVPILLYAPKTKIIAAVHAGWRGIACEIIAKAIECFEQMGAERDELIACTGPCISVDAYQVGKELIDGFSLVFSAEEMSQICIKKGDGFHADLRNAAYIQLKNAGIDAKNISIHSGCTFSDKRYFSARRQTVQSGRLLSGILLI